MGINLLVALPSFGHGGCEYNALTVALFFQRRFLDDITVLLPEEGDTTLIRSAARDIGLRVEPMPVDVKQVTEAGAFDRQVEEWTAFLRQRKPDAVFVHFPWYHFGTALPVGAHRAGVPALVHFALVHESWEFPQYTLAPLREALAGQQHWYTLSALNSALLAAALSVDKELIGHMHAAPMGMRYIARQNGKTDLRREIGAGVRTDIIICVARLDWQKASMF